MDADAGAVGGLTAGVGVCGCVEIVVVPVFRVWIHCVCMCEWRSMKSVCSRENMVLHLQSEHMREDKLERDTQYMTCIQRHLRPCSCLHTHTHKENERESMNLARSLPLIPSRTLALDLARVRAISLALLSPTLTHTRAYTARSHMRKHARISYRNVLKCCNGKLVTDSTHTITSHPSSHAHTSFAPTHTFDCLGITVLLHVCISVCHLQWLSWPVYYSTLKGKLNLTQWQGVSIKITI